MFYFDSVKTDTNNNDGLEIKFLNNKIVVTRISNKQIFEDR